MVRYAMLAAMMLAFQDWAGKDGSAELLSSVIALWACGVAFYEIHIGNSPLLVPKRKKSPATGPAERDR